MKQKQCLLSPARISACVDVRMILMKCMVFLVLRIIVIFCYTKKQMSRNSNGTHYI